MADIGASAAIQRVRSSVDFAAVSQRGIAVGVARVTDDVGVRALALNAELVTGANGAARATIGRV